MRELNTVCTSRWRWLLLALWLACFLVVLTACSADDARDEDPPDPEPPNNGEITGTFVTQDLNAAIPDDPEDNLGGTITVIDQTHTPVLRQNVTDPSFSVMTELLEPPYFLTVADQPSGISIRSIATGAGTVNITPLTDIVSDLLLARAQDDGFLEPDDYYDNFGLLPRPTPGTQSFPPPEPGPSDPSRINGTAIARAETATRNALAGIGVEVDPSIESFISQPFEAEEGDPMYDTIADFIATLRNRNQTLEDFKDQLLANDRICQTAAKISVTVDGASALFCPVNRTAETSDDGRIYRFVTVDGDDLVLEISNGAVISAELDIQALGAFSCSDGGCTGIGVSDSNDEPGSVDIVLDNAVLSNNTTTAMLDGTLVGPPPAFPSLSMDCAGNLPFYFSTESGQRVSGCARDVTISNEFEGNRLFKGTTDSGYVITVALDDGDQVVFVSVAPAFDNDDPPEDFIAFKCRRDEPAASCAGVDFTEPDSDGVSSLTFADVPLLGVEEDGSLTSMQQASLNGAIRTQAPGMLPAMPEPNSEGEALNGRVSPDCGAIATTNVINANVTDGNWQLCVADSFGDDSGGIVVSRTDELVVYEFQTVIFTGGGEGPDLSVFRRDHFSVVVDSSTGNVVKAEFTRNFSTNEFYVCGYVTDCQGVTVSEPGGDGVITITVDSLTLSEVQSFSQSARGQFPTSFTPEGRTATLEGELKLRLCEDDSDVNCSGVSAFPEDRVSELLDR